MKLVPEVDANFRFTATWIGPQHEIGKTSSYFDARTEFELDAVPESALLRITADTTYDLVINRIACGHGPVRGTAALHYFDTIDVAAALQAGHNEITVRVFSPAKEDFTCASVAPALLLELPGVVKSTTDWRIRLLPEWHRDVPLFTLQTGFMELRDFRVVPGEWLPAAEVTAPRLLAKRLLPRDVPGLECCLVRPISISARAAVPPGDAENIEALPNYLNEERWTPLDENRFSTAAATKLLPKPYGSGGAMIESFNAGSSTTAAAVLQPAPDGAGAALVWDFSSEWIGRLALEVDAPAGTIVDLVYGEEPWHDGRLRAAFPRDIYRFTDRYILKEGRNTIGTTMTERGFRYVQAVFRNFTSPIVLHDISARVISYGYIHYGAFQCSDPLLNVIYNQCVTTLQACTTDIFLDCPWRERSFWVNDLVVENRTSLAAFGASDVHRRAFRLAFSQQRPDGLVPGLCPQPEGENFVLPATNFFLVMMLSDYYNFSGDAETIRTHLGAVEKIFDSFESRVDSDGLTRSPIDFWNFYDWGFELDGYSFNNLRESMINSLYVLALKLFLKLDDAVGFHSPRRAEYRSRIERTSQAIERVFRDPESGYLVDPVKLHDKESTICSQLAHALALLAGVGSESLRRSCIAALTDESLHIPEFYLHDFVFQAMARHGLVQNGVERVRRWWGRMALTTHPTLYEAGIHMRGREAFDETGSLCHGFGTGPIAFFQNGILGVTPTSGGFATFDFRPDRAGLEFAEGRIPTPHGEVIKVRLDDTGAAIDIPPHCKAQLKNGTVLPAGSHHLNWEDVK